MYVLSGFDSSVRARPATAGPRGVGAAYARTAMSLEPLDAGVYVWMPEGPPGRGSPNAGAVVDPDGITLIDTLMVPDQYEPFGAAVEALGLPVRTAWLRADG